MQKLTKSQTMKAWLRLRRDLGFTQEQIGNILKISPSYASKIERQVEQPSPLLFYRIYRIVRACSEFNLESIEDIDNEKIMKR